MQPMTIEQLAEMRHATLRNVADLIADAELLAANRRYPRACSLAVLACEESTKVPALTNAAMEIAAGKDVDWKRLRRRLVLHEPKLRMVQLYNVVFDKDSPGILPLSIDPARMARQRAWAKATNALKLDGLYVGARSDGPISQPSESVSAEQAKTMIETGRALLKFFSFAECTLGTAIDKRRHEPEFQDLLRGIQTAADKSVGALPIARPVASAPSGETDDRTG